MDPNNVILANVREVVGCNGVRNFLDMGKMRQETIERRLLGARGKLTAGSMASIYAVWLTDQVSRIGGDEREAVVKCWCSFLASWGCDKDQAHRLWTACRDRTIYGANRGARERVKRQMDAVSEDINRYYPLIVTPDTVYGDEDRADLPRDQRTPKSQDLQPQKTLSLPSTTNAKSRFQSEIDLKRESWKKAPVPAFAVDTSKSQRGSQTKVSVPKNYLCKRCGEEGHFVQDCPTNSDPAWDLRPKSSYTCNNCGRRGDHFITSCPKARPHIVERSLEPRNPAGGGEDLILARAQQQGTDGLDGRLSPWSETSSQGSQDVADQGDPKDDFELDVDNFLLGLEDATRDGGSMRWEQASTVAFASSPSTPMEMADPDQHLNKRQKMSDQDGDAVWQPVVPDNFWPPLDEPDFHHGSVRIDDWDVQSSISSRPVSTVEAYVTEKRLDGGDRPYDPAVMELFRCRDNVWVNHTRRPTALDSW